MLQALGAALLVQGQGRSQGQYFYLGQGHHIYSQPPAYANLNLSTIMVHTCISSSITPRIKHLILNLTTVHHMYCKSTNSCYRFIFTKFSKLKMLKFSMMKAINELK